MRDLHTNNKKTITTVLILGLLVLTGLSAGMLLALDDEPVKQSATIQPEPKQVTKVEPATTVRFTATAGQTVLEQLKQAARGVTVKQSSYGAYVDAINGISGGTDNKYWSYYVNGQMANIGAGEYKTKGGEEIVWKFE